MGRSIKETICHEMVLNW